MQVDLPSWFGTSELTWVQRLGLRVVGAGAVPKHVAFIMDGNRRYARRKHMGSVVKGHHSGFKQLAHTLKWCRDMGIAEVTVYAFSVENFKRSDEEVNGLFDLARAKFQELLDEAEKVTSEGIRFCFIGEWSLLPLDLQRLMARIEQLTESNTSARVNVCIAYTSQQEMTTATNTLTRAVKEGVIDAGDVNERSFDMVMQGVSPPDLLVRTSGESRLSDFLLHQSTYTSLYFSDVLWPDFTFWHLCWAVMHYQANVGKIEATKAAEVRDADEMTEEKGRSLHDWMTEETIARRARLLIDA